MAPMSLASGRMVQSKGRGTSDWMLPDCITPTGSLGWDLQIHPFDPYGGTRASASPSYRETGLNFRSLCQRKIFMSFLRKKEACLGL